MTKNTSFETLAILASTMGLKIRSIAISYTITVKHIRWLSENTKWYDSKKSRYENKESMKELGSAVMGMQEFICEMTILSLAKVMEDMRYDARRILDCKIDFWDSYNPIVPFHDELRKVYHLSNVIKHNRSIIERRSSKSSKILVDSFGMKDGTMVILIDLDYRSMIFYCYFALSDIIGRLSGFEPRDYPKNPSNLISEFYRYMIPDTIDNDSA